MKKKIIFNETLKRGILGLVLITTLTFFNIFLIHTNLKCCSDLSLSLNNQVPNKTQSFYFACKSPAFLPVYEFHSSHKIDNLESEFNQKEQMKLAFRWQVFDSLYNELYPRKLSEILYASTDAGVVMHSKIKNKTLC